MGSELSQPTQRSTPDLSDPLIDKNLDTVARKLKDICAGNINETKEITVYTRDNIMIFAESESKTYTFFCKFEIHEREVMPIFEEFREKTIVGVKDQYHELGKICLSNLSLFSKILAACKSCKIKRNHIIPNSVQIKLIIKHVARTLGFYMEHGDVLASAILRVRPGGWELPQESVIEEKRKQLMSSLSTEAKITDQK